MEWASDTPAVQQLIHKHTLRVLEAQEAKGEAARNKPSRGVLAAEFDGSALVRSNHEDLKTFVIENSYPPSTTAVKWLHPIALSELVLETHHADRFLVVRTFGHAVRIAGVHNCIEDANGDVDVLCVYNTDPEVPPAELLPRNSIFAIKEPFYREVQIGRYYICVDHPSDLVALGPYDPILPAQFRRPRGERDADAASKKQAGDAAYENEDYRGALSAYSQGIAHCLPAELLLKCELFRGRAKTNLELRRFEAARNDALDSLLQEGTHGRLGVQNNNKAYYYAGRAADKLGQFNQCLEHYQKALELIPTDGYTHAQMARTKKRVDEGLRGMYDFARMREAVSAGNPYIDSVTFAVNTQIADAGDKGRGVFARRDLMAGELVMVEKALAASFPPKEPSEFDYVVDLNLSLAAKGMHAPLLFDIVEILLHSPNRAQKFFDLSDGGWHSPRCEAKVVDGVVATDIFHVVSTMQKNTFYFESPFGNPSQSTSNGQASKQPAGLGIWVNASYINHSCIANVHATFIGDMMILRASKPIAKGEEIFIRYLSPFEEFNYLQSTLAKIWKFMCHCALCTAERATPNHDVARRMQVAAEVNTFLESSPISAANPPSRAMIERAEKLGEAMEKTYGVHTAQRLPRVGLIGLGAMLCLAYHLIGDSHRTIEQALRMLRDTGIEARVVSNKLGVDRSLACCGGLFVPDSIMYAADACKALGNMDLCKQFKVFALRQYIIVHGDSHGWDARYAERTHEPRA